MSPIDNLILFGLFFPACFAGALLWCALEWWRNPRLALASALAFVMLAPILFPHVRASLAAEREALAWAEIDFPDDGVERPNPVIDGGRQTVWERVQLLIVLGGVLCFLAAIVLAILDLVRVRPIRAAPIVLLGCLLLRIVFAVLVASG